MENGIVKRVIGPVVDVQFPAGKLPEINNAIEVHAGKRRIVMEAVQQSATMRFAASRSFPPTGCSAAASPWTPARA